MKTKLAAQGGGLVLALILSGPAMAAGGTQAGATRDIYGVSHPSFSQLDIDGNGALSEAESAGTKGLLDYWDQADRNHDDVIERSEFAAFEAMDPLPPAVTPQRMPEPGASPAY